MKRSYLKTKAAHLAPQALQKNVNRFVTRKPYKAIGLVAVTALCLGFIINKGIND